MPSRRDFLYQLGISTLGLMGLRVMPGCEHIEVESKISGEMVQFLTPADDGVWYWQSGNTTAKSDAPDIAREDWSMRIEDGQNVSETVTFSDLEALAERGEALSYIKTMRCVFGTNIGTLFDSLVSTGVFKGIPVYKLLETLDLDDEAVKLRTFGADGFTSNIPMERALKTGPKPLPVLLAYEINGRELPRLRGGPVRLIIPEMWGYKNMKWLDKLVASKDDSYFGTYETQRFADDPNQDIIDDPAKIALTSTVSRPALNGQDVEGPDVTIAGTSFAGGTAVEETEIKLDDGSWERVEILSQKDVKKTLPTRFEKPFEEAEQTGGQWPPPNVWTVWAKSFEGVSKGRHTVTIRGSDQQGRTQKGSPGNIRKVSPQVRVEFNVT